MFDGATTRRVVLSSRAAGCGQERAAWQRGQTAQRSRGGVGQQAPARRVRGQQYCAHALRHHLPREARSAVNNKSLSA